MADASGSTYKCVRLPCFAPSPPALFQAASPHNSSYNWLAAVDEEDKPAAKKKVVYGKKKPQPKPKAAEGEAQPSTAGASDAAEAQAAAEASTAAAQAQAEEAKVQAQQAEEAQQQEEAEVGFLCITMLTCNASQPVNARGNGRPGRGGLCQLAGGLC